MDNLLKNRRVAPEEKRKSVKTAYSMDGRVMKGRAPKGTRWAVIILAVLVFLAAVLYLPPLFYHPKDDNSYIPVPADAGAIKVYQTYLKDHPEDDFDNDGLDNSLENEYGTDVWEADSDGDGVSDYAELFLTETSPTEATTVLVDQVARADEDSGSSLGTPYKIDDIIFWPDDYQSKAYGAVVRTLFGYRFCNFTGWVKFPQQVYAYGCRDGVHYELEHRELEDAWKIESSDEVFLYAQPLEFVHEFSVPFAKPVLLGDGLPGRILSRLLPDRGGVLNCRRVAVADTDTEDPPAVTAMLRNPLVDRFDPARLTRNMNTLKDLSWVRKVLEAGECIAASLYSGSAGESIVIIYGYTQDGNLLAADESLNPVGTITVSEYATRMMDKEGTVGQTSWFEWKGLGFDSAKYGDRINFFASTLTGAQEILQDAGGTEMPETEAETMASEAPEPESMTPETMTPETVVPETMAPETTPPETMAPETTPPETYASETDPPETMAPETEPVTEDSVITFGF